MGTVSGHLVNLSTMVKRYRWTPMLMLVEDPLCQRARAWISSWVQILASWVLLQAENWTCPWHTADNPPGTRLHQAACGTYSQMGQSLQGQETFRLSTSGMKDRWPPLDISHNSFHPCRLTCISCRDVEEDAFRVAGQSSWFRALLV